MGKLKANYLLRYVALMIIVFITSNAIAKASFEQLSAAAISGNSEAQNTLGLAYFSGQKGPSQFQEAFKWFEKAAAQNHPAAMYNLGAMYYYGKAVPIDKNQAVHWFKKAADAGNPDALYLLGTMYQSGEMSGIVDLRQAEIYVRKAAEKGFSQAQNRLGYFYFQGMGVETNYNIGHEWYLKAANAGLSKAQYNVGEDYWWGVGVEMDKEKAKLWYKKAADAGFSDAELKYFSILFSEGRTQEAKSVLEKASKNGNTEASEALSFMVAAQEDPSLPKDPSEALRFYANKAQSGDRDAQYQLGRLYLGMHDEKEGVKWIEAAAMQGHPFAVRLTEINSRYHENNKYINKLNTKAYQDATQKERNLQDLRNSVGFKGR